MWFWLCRSVVRAHVAGCLVYSCMLRWFRSRLLLLLLFLSFFLFWFVPRLVASFVLFRFLLLVLALAPPPSAAAAAAPPDGGWIGCTLLRSLPFLVASGSLFRLLMLFFARAPPPPLAAAPPVGGWVSCAFLNCGGMGFLLPVLFNFGRFLSWLSCSWLGSSLSLSGSVCFVVVSVGVCGALVVCLFSGIDSSSLSELSSCFAIFAV